MLLALCTTLLRLAPAAQDPRAGAEPDGNKLVRVELVADRAKIHPGEHFTLAAKLGVTPGWHIYWGENPGDSGVPTRLEIEAPKEFVIGAPQFPVPQRHVDPGDLVIFIHEGQTLVLFDAVAPPKLEPGAKLRFELSASWLVCTTRCYQGEGEAALELECAAAGEPAPANEALFKDARARLPRKLAQLEGLVSGLTLDAQEPAECHLALSVAGALELSFFPGDQRDPAFVSAKGSQEKLELVYRWKERPNGRVNVGCPGILSVKTKDGTANYWFDKKFFAGS